jgi:hypothetical protein
MLVIGSATEYHDVPNGDSKSPIINLTLTVSYLAVNLTDSAGLARRLGMTIIPGRYIVSVSLKTGL